MTQIKLENRYIQRFMPLLTSFSLIICLNLALKFITLEAIVLKSYARFKAALLAASHCSNIAKLPPIALCPAWPKKLGKVKLL